MHFRRVQIVRARAIGDVCAVPAGKNLVGFDDIHRTAMRANFVW